MHIQDQYNIKLDQPGTYNLYGSKLESIYIHTPCTVYYNDRLIATDKEVPHRLQYIDISVYVYCSVSVGYVNRLYIEENAVVPYSDAIKVAIKPNCDVLQLGKHTKSVSVNKDRITANLDQIDNLYLINPDMSWLSASCTCSVSIDSLTTSVYNTDNLPSGVTRLSITCMDLNKVHVYGRPLKSLHVNIMNECELVNIECELHKLVCVCLGNKKEICVKSSANIANTIGDFIILDMPDLTNILCFVNINLHTLCSLLANEKQLYISTRSYIRFRRL